jgi:hypothetical protein
MRLFLYEWTCCTPAPPPSLRREGWAMLWAILADFHKTRQHDTVTLVHEALPHLVLRPAEHAAGLYQDVLCRDDLAGQARAQLYGPRMKAVPRAGHSHEVGRIGNKGFHGRFGTP